MSPYNLDNSSIHLEWKANSEWIKCNKIHLLSSILSASNSAILFSKSEFLLECSLLVSFIFVC